MSTQTTITINGVATQVPSGAVAYKYADPTEDARWIYDEAEALEIEREDPSLIVRARKSPASATVPSKAPPTKC